MDKVVLWELCKKFKFDHTNKYVQPEIRPKNETHKILWDFEIKTDHLISVRRPDFVIIGEKKRKENLPKSGLCHSARAQVETERKQKER